MAEACQHDKGTCRGNSNAVLTIMKLLIHAPQPLAHTYHALYLLWETYARILHNGRPTSMSATLQQATCIQCQQIQRQRQLLASGASDGPAIDQSESHGVWPHSCRGQC